MLAVYGYHAYNYYECGGSMYIHRPDPSPVSYTHLDVYKRQVRQQHDQAVNAEAQTTCGGQAVLKGGHVVIVDLCLAVRLDRCV